MLHLTGAFVAAMSSTSQIQCFLDRGIATMLFVAPFMPPYSQPKRGHTQHQCRRPRHDTILPTGAWCVSAALRQTVCLQVTPPTLSTELPEDPLSVSLDSENVDVGGRDIHKESLTLLEWPQISAHVLRHASTTQGRLALCASSTGLLVPTTRAESERLLAETREVSLLEYALCKPLNFSGVHDVAPLVQLAEKGKMLTGKQLISVAETLRAARNIRRHIEAAVPPGASAHPEDLSILKEMVSTFRTWPDAERDISRCIDDFGDVVDSADPELRGIRNSLREALSEVRAQLNGIMSRHAEAIQDRVITQRYDRFVIPVKMSRKADFRRGTVHDASASGSTAYIEPASVRPLNDRLRELAARERARVNAILRRLSGDVVAPIADDICNLGHVLAQLDAAAARARCSHSLDAIDVVFDDTKPLKLLGARHPLLSWKAKAEAQARQSDSTARDTSALSGQRKDETRFVKTRSEPEWKSAVIPSSYVLDDDVRCVCVTGPNTGGKTLSLKTLGTCVLMAKAGLFVPAKSPSFLQIMARENRLDTAVNKDDEEEELDTARIPFFDSVLADIGDDQSLVQSLSTFSGHVRRIKRILAASTPRTLVLLDEIGSGTVRTVMSDRIPGTTICLEPKSFRILLTLCRHFANCCCFSFSFPGPC